jgi:hypothetical protein
VGAEEVGVQVVVVGIALPVVWGAAVVGALVVSGAAAVVMELVLSTALRLVEAMGVMVEHS